VRYDNDDYPIPTPPSVVAAAAFGTIPIPFIAVYAVLFIVHGTVHPVVPPDITNSKNGELVAGIIAAVLLLISLVALLWVVNGRRRWPFVLVQLGMLGAACYFLVDKTAGGTTASVAIAVTTLGALITIFVPSAWEHFGMRMPGTRARGSATVSMPAGSTAVSDASPATARVAGRPRPPSSGKDPR